MATTAKRCKRFGFMHSQRMKQITTLAFMAMFAMFIMTFTITSPAHALENLQSTGTDATQTEGNDPDAGLSTASDDGDDSNIPGETNPNPGPQNPDNDVDVNIPQDGMSYVNSTTTPTEDNDLMTGVTPVVPPENPEIKDNFEFVFVGSDKISNYYSAFGWTEPSQDLPNETPFQITEDLMVYVGAAYQTMKNYGLVVDKAYLVNTSQGLAVVPAQPDNKIPARWANLQQILLVDRNGKLVTTYCADQTTSTVDDFNYIVENLDDATYYTEEEADMIRSVALNGYWGTESGLGSLANVKRMMIESGEFTQAEADSLTDGMALAATQYAIWNFSNKMNDVIFYNTYRSDHLCTSTACFKKHGYQSDDAANNLIFKLYQHLINLEPSTLEDRTTKNTIINEDHYLNSMEIVPTSKPLFHPNNIDFSDDNDVYVTDINFQLSVQPDPNEDDLLITLLDADGNVVAKGRIAGELREGEKLVLNNGNGIFTITDITMQEGNFVLTATLSGTQYLARDAYLFSSEVVDGVSSQTLVGVAEGPYSVNVSAELNFSMDPDDSEIPPTGGEDEPPEDPNNPPEDPNEPPEDPNVPGDPGEENPPTGGNIPPVDSPADKPKQETVTMNSAATSDNVPVQAPLAIALLGFAGIITSMVARRKASKNN